MRSFIRQFHNSLSLYVHIAPWLPYICSASWQKLVSCVFQGLDIEHLFVNLASGKIKYCFEKVLNFRSKKLYEPCKPRQVPAFWPFINPLSPNIHIQILQTGLYTFSWRISWENLIIDQGIFCVVIILLILITLSLDNVWISLGENWCWSLLGNEGLMSLPFVFVSYFRGLIACIAVFLLFGVTQIRDGPFKRPHPGRHGMASCFYFGFIFRVF